MSESAAGDGAAAGAEGFEEFLVAAGGVANLGVFFGGGAVVPVFGMLFSRWYIKFSATLSRVIIVW